MLLSSEASARATDAPHRRAVRDANEHGECEKQGEGHRRGGGAEPHIAEPQLTEAQLQHQAGLARMLGDLDRWGGHAGGSRPASPLPLWA